MYIYSLIANVCRRPRSSLPVWYYTIPYLEINTCSRMADLLSPTIGNPDDFDITRSPAYCQFITAVSCPFEQTFQDGFFSGFVLLCRCWSAAPATVSPWYTPHFRDCLQKFDGFVVFFFVFRACCVVVEFHSSHSFAIFFFRFCRL